MASVDRVTPVDVRRDEEPVAAASAEGVGLVGARVGAEDGARVDVVCVCFAAAGVVGWEAEGVEVLVYADDGGEGVVGGVDGGWELGFDEGAGYGEGVGGLEVEFAGEGGGDVGGEVGPGVCGVGARFKLD